MSSFTLFKYTKEDGSFDYERYRRIQEEGNKRKINNVWVEEANIAFLSTYILGLMPRVRLASVTARGAAWSRSGFGGI